MSFAELCTVPSQGAFTPTALASMHPGAVLVLAVVAVAELVVRGLVVLEIVVVVVVVLASVITKVDHLPQNGLAYVCYAGLRWTSRCGFSAGHVAVRGRLPSCAAAAAFAR